jgi:sulfatase modifying factor 1
MWKPLLSALYPPPGHGPPAAARMPWPCVPDRSPSHPVTSLPRRLHALTRAPRVVLLAVLTSCGLSSWTQAGEPSAPVALPADAPSGEVPAAFLDRLRAQYVSEEIQTPDISDGDKVRRYETILREGAWAERQHPKASNLCQVRELMLAAAKGLATLEGTAEARERLMALARRLAEPDAPPDTRVVADLLILRARVDELAEGPSEAAEEIGLFVNRYAGTPADYKALMGAAEFCRIVDAGTLRQEYLRRLARNHFSAPGVAEYLEVEGANPYLGRLMGARLTALNGTTVTLPRDLLGKFTLVHFWSLARPGLVARDGNLKAFYEKYRKDGLEIVSVNLDTDLAQVAQFVQDQGLGWIQTCSGLGMKDPTFLRYRVPVLPAFWVVSPDGRAISNNYHAHSTVQQLGPYSNAISNYLSWLRETAIRVPYYRTGEFLLDVPALRPAAAPGARDVPAGALEAIRAKVFLPPALGLTADQKAERFREALRLGTAIESDYPQAARLALVRNWMLVTARWLATETRDAAYAKQAQEIAGRILASQAEGGLRLLADYVRAAGDLSARELSREDIARQIDGFVQSAAQSEVSWAAEILGVLLATECGDEDARAIRIGELRDHQNLQPKVRGFLRDFCNLNVDARTAFYQPWPLPGVPAQVQTIRAELPGLDGRTLRLPDDAKGKMVVVHFWSVACPPETTVSTAPGHRGPSALSPSTVHDLVVVGVNLDRSRPDVEAFLKNRYKDWIHVFSGKGWDDPLARELDVYGLPRSVLLDRDGTIYRWGTPGQMGDAVYRASLIPPAGAPPAHGQRGAPAATPGISAPSPPAPGSTLATVRVEDLKKEIALDLGGHVTMKLALLPAGQFKMGAPQNEKGRFDDEIPIRMVTLSRPFYMGIHPLTRGQFAAFIKDSGYGTEAEKDGWAFVWSGSRWEKINGASWKKPGFDQDDDHPVVCVSWHDAMAFCAWLSRKSGKAVRLPTEAQWEYACRAGTTTAYLWGDDPEEGKGWCNGADQTAGKQFPIWTTFGWDDGYVFTSPVGRFKANAFGLHDMTGNVWQWCADWYDKEYLKLRGARIDPAGPAAGTYRVARGGSWHSSPPYCRSAARRKESPAFRLNVTGFRVVLDVE